MKVACLFVTMLLALQTLDATKATGRGSREVRRENNEVQEKTPGSTSKRSRSQVHTPALVPDAVAKKSSGKNTGSKKARIIIDAGSGMDEQVDQSYVDRILGSGVDDLNGVPALQPDRKFQVGQSDEAVAQSDHHHVPVAAAARVKDDNFHWYASAISAAVALGFTIYKHW